MPRLLKTIISLTFCLAAFLVGGFVYAAEVSAAETPTSVIQPASPADGPAEATKIGDLGHYIDEYSSYVSTNTAWHFSETAHFPDVHIGEQGVGGVTFFNGTIVNTTTSDSGADLPVTFGDMMRIDGSIYRGTSKGTSDNMPLKIADTVVPELTAINDFGSTEFKWNDAYFYGTVWMGKLGGDNVVTEENLAATNSAVANYVLAYDSSGNFKWTSSTLSALACSTGQVAKWNGSAWACAEDIDTTTGGSTPTPPAGSNTKIVYGRTQVPAFDDYGDNGTAVSIPAGTFTSTSTYTVTASYLTSSVPQGMAALDLACEETQNDGHCLSVGVVKDSVTQFTLYTNFPDDVDGNDPWVSWQATGY